LHEETGLQGHVTRLIGIYTNPHLRVECTDGDRIQPVACSFEVAVTGGELTLSDETTCAGRLLYPGRVLGTRADRLPENHRGWSKRPAQAMRALFWQRRRPREVDCPPPLRDGRSLDVRPNVAC